VLQSRDGRKGEEPNRAPRVPLDGRLRLLRDTVGPGPGRSRHFASRGWEEVDPRFSKSRWAKRRRA
jgi:hypothetical protein